MPSTIAASKEAPAAEKDFLPLQGTDYIQFYVGNAKQVAHFYKTAFGFQSLAYSGPETGTSERVEALFDVDGPQPSPRQFRERDAGRSVV